ncbi:hypothetical protein ACWJJH_02260 [Endozoicomonadaceae bacterium StTr2]
MTHFRDLNPAEDISIVSAPFGFLGGKASFIRFVSSKGKYHIELITPDSKNPRFRLLQGIVIEHERISAREKVKTHRSLQHTPFYASTETGYRTQINGLNLQADEDVFHFTPLFCGRWHKSPEESSEESDVFYWEILKPHIALMKRSRLAFEKCFEEGSVLIIESPDFLGFKTDGVILKAEQMDSVYSSCRYRTLSFHWNKSGKAFLQKRHLKGSRNSYDDQNDSFQFRLSNTVDECLKSGEPDRMSIKYRIQLEKNKVCPPSSDALAAFKGYPLIFDMESPKLTVTWHDEPAAIYLHLFNFDQCKAGTELRSQPFDFCGNALVAGVYPRGKTNDDQHLVVTLYQLLPYACSVCSIQGYFIKHQPLNSCDTETENILQCYVSAFVSPEPSETADACCNQPSEVVVSATLSAQYVDYVSGYEELTLRPVFMAGQEKVVSDSVAAKKQIHYVFSTPSCPEELEWNKNFSQPVCFLAHQVASEASDNLMDAESPVGADLAAVQSDPSEGSHAASPTTIKTETYRLVFNRCMLAIAKRGLFTLESDTIGNTGVSLCLGNTSTNTMGQYYTECTFGLKGKASRTYSFDISYITSRIGRDWVDTRDSETHIWHHTVTKDESVNASITTGRITRLLDNAFGHELTVIVRVSESAETR